MLYLVLDNDSESGTDPTDCEDSSFDVNVIIVYVYLIVMKFKNVHVLFQILLTMIMTYFQ